MNINYNEQTLPYLLEKLDCIKLQPKNILVIGHPAIKNKILTWLKALYSEAQCDFLFQHIRNYPLKTNHYELIFCHWLQPTELLPDDMADNILSTYELLFYLFHHFLNPKGLLLFSCLGAETTLPGLMKLTELNTPELAELIHPRMSALGNILLKLDYQDPVLDRDCLSYEAGSLELVYGHAWKKTELERNFSRPNEEGIVFMPISQIQHLEMAD